MRLSSLKFLLPLALSFLLILPCIAFAAEYKLQMPSSPYNTGLEMPLTNDSSAMPTPGQYIKTFFTYGLGLVGIAALFAIAFGGITYLLSAGSETQKTTAKQWIWGAMSGVILLLISFLILNTIHPQFVSLKEPNLNQEVQQSSGQTGLIEIPLLSGEAPKTPSDYTRIAFLFGLGIVGIAALFALTFGGFNYILSAGSIVSKDEGKKWIIGAVSGIALLLCSYLILATINPQLISLVNPKLETIEIPPHLGLGYNLTNAQIASLPIFTNADVNQAIKDASARYGVPEDIIRAVLGRESAGDIKALSPKGAQGLMQLMPGTAAQMGVTNPYDPVQNIYGGVKYLSLQYQRFGNWTDALAAYNAGPERVVQYGSGANVPFTETQQYISTIRSMVPQYF